VPNLRYELNISGEGETGLGFQLQGASVSRANRWLGTLRSSTAPGASITYSRFADIGRTVRWMRGNSRPRTSVGARHRTRKVARDFRRVFVDKTKHLSALSGALRILGEGADQPDPRKRRILPGDTSGSHVNRPEKVLRVGSCPMYCHRHGSSRPTGWREGVGQSQPTSQNSLEELSSARRRNSWIVYHQLVPSDGKCHQGRDLYNVH